jgi:prepilin-type N-terminal cleavage/methylation domain-containing protein
MKRLKGYTIWEIIIVMVISSIVITLAASVFFRIRNYFHTNTGVYISGTDFIVLSDIMKRDFDRARVIHNKDSIIYLIDNKSRISYRFSEQYIVRNNNMITDTFHFVTGRFHVGTLPDHPDMIGQVEFEVILKKLKIPFCYYKQYEKQVLYETDKSGGDKFE